MDLVGASGTWVGPGLRGWQLVPRRYGKLCHGMMASEGKSLGQGQ